MSSLVRRIPLRLRACAAIALIAGAASCHSATSSPPPTQVTKNAGDNQTATAGTAVPIPPSVIVQDQAFNPVAGYTVTFSVASGGGSITGADAVTNSSGIATVGSWTLGAVPGTNTLTVTAVGLAGSGLIFTATGN